MQTSRQRVWVFSLLTVLATAVAACGLLFPSLSTSDPAFGDLGVSNGTTLPVTILVNGLVVATVEPGAGGGVARGSLPPMPWAIEAQAPSGRVLVSFAADAANVHQTMYPNGQSETLGALGRVDLSCGRLDVWVGFQPSGPYPGPGTPGDCAP